MGRSKGEPRVFEFDANTDRQQTCYLMVMMMMMMMVVYVGGVGSCDGLSKTHFFLSHCPLSPLPSGLMWIFSTEFLYFSLCHFLVVIVFEGKLLPIFANTYFFRVYVFFCEWRVLLILDCSGQK